MYGILNERREPKATTPGIFSDELFQTKKKKKSLENLTPLNRISRDFVLFILFNFAEKYIAADFCNVL